MRTHLRQCHSDSKQVCFTQASIARCFEINRLCVSSKQRMQQPNDDWLNDLLIKWLVFNYLPTLSAQIGYIVASVSKSRDVVMQSLMMKHHSKLMHCSVTVLYVLHYSFDESAFIHEWKDAIVTKRIPAPLLHLTITQTAQALHDREQFENHPAPISRQGSTYTVTSNVFTGIHNICRSSPCPLEDTGGLCWAVDCGACLHILPVQVIGASMF